METNRKQRSMSLTDGENSSNARNSTDNVASGTRSFRKSLYKYSHHVHEDHGQPLFGVQFNQFLKKQAMFATVGKDRVSIYECPWDGGIKILQAYADPDPNENFYTCAWTYDPKDRRPILAAAGMRGIIRIFDPLQHSCKKHYIGHGSAINDLKFHPKLPELLLSASKDYSLRLWNIGTHVCVAIFGGVEGHRAEILSVDFHISGDRIVSSGMDHALKIWRLDEPAVKNAIDSSFSFDIDKEKTSFSSVKQHYPVFTTRNIHSSYVDCVQWFGNLLISKSCENSIVLWKPGKLEDKDLKPQDPTATVLHRFEYKKCEIWFLRFAFNLPERMLALGNQCGTMFIWQLDSSNTSLTKCNIAKHPKCNTAIRQTAFCRDGSILLCACDDGTIWRWDRIK